MQPYQPKHAARTEQPYFRPAPSSVPAHQPRHVRASHKKKLILLIVLFLLLLPFVAGLVEPLILRVDETVWECEDLPYDIGQLRVAYISDIHYGFFFSESRLSSLVSRINSMKADIVIFGGDYGKDSQSALEFFSKLGKMTIHARYKILGVVGECDTDKTDEGLVLLTDAMKNAGVTPLINTVEPVRIGKDTIWVAGIDDPVSGSPALKNIAASVDQDDFVIFAAHNPVIIREAQQNSWDKNGKLNWFDLALFGHTHGGQFSLLEEPIGLTVDIEPRYRSGWLTENRIPILISNGVGTSVIPFRLFCPPQIHQIDLHSN